MPRKQLIEFGWDEPDPAFMRAHIAAMQATPFDGCVFHPVADHDDPPPNFTWRCWSNVRYERDAFDACVTDLLAARASGGFSHNFLRFNTTPADIDWFDDYSAVVHNAEVAASVARDGGCAGILFDIEQYNAQLFDYSALGESTGRPWNAYAAQARLRGSEVMAAFQRGFPGVQVFLTFGYCLPWNQMQRQGSALDAVPYGLLAPFLDGMTDACAGGASLIDGHESSYAYREPEQFDEARRRLETDVLAIVADPTRYAEAFRVSFGLWLDCDWRDHGWDVADFTSNHHQPEQFGRCLRRALDLADDYVWIYTETPRWWSEDGPVALPAAYVDAIQDAVASHRG
jgi:hypothetical protein